MAQQGLHGWRWRTAGQAVVMTLAYLGSTAEATLDGVPI